MFNSLSQTCLEGRELGFAIAGHQLLAGVDLALQPGRLCGLIGHNGSGKSTLLHMLAGQHTPTSGRILLDGIELDRWSQRAFARRVAYLPQNLPEATGLTVYEFAALGRYPWHGAVGRFGNRDRAQVNEGLRLAGMTGFSDRLVDTLSGGERQRAWLAMLIAQDSGCMLLDEPIAALDVAHQIDVMECVRRLCRERELAVLVVLHDVNVAARFCDELVALSCGERIVSGSPTEVVQPDTLERIYGVPMGVVRPDDQCHPLSYVA